MINLTSDEISLLNKSDILQRFHRYIRLWYISSKLPQTMLDDSSFKPFFTPCSGHSILNKNLDENEDQIDGVLSMEAYCEQCKKQSTVSLLFSCPLPT